MRHYIVTVVMATRGDSITWAQAYEIAAQSAEQACNEAHMLARAMFPTKEYYAIQRISAMQGEEAVA